MTAIALQSQLSMLSMALGCRKESKESFRNVLLDVNLLVLICSDIFGVEPELIKSKSRKREAVSSRRMIFQHFKDHTSRSLSSIAGIFGKDHATVLHALREFDNLMDTDKEWRQQVAEFRQKTL